MNEMLGIAANVGLKCLPEASAANVMLRQQSQDESKYVREPVRLTGRQEDVELAVEPRDEPVRSGWVLTEELGGGIAEAVRDVGKRTDP